ncbi:MAG: hypothetical protein JO092_01520 [Candidatus Eremiobacteraeota bacterium]|nr:hypothetical protein [Candidatus Eremiobacteraeota bacterium]
MLQPLLFAALSAGSPFLTPGTFSYSATLAGDPTGTSSLIVRRDAQATTIQEKASGLVNGLRVSATAQLTVGPDLAPQIYNGTYESSGARTVVTASLSPSAATVISSGSAGQPATFSLSGDAKHFVVIEPGLLAGLFALPAEMEAWKDAPVLAIAPSYGRGENLFVDTSVKAQRPSAVPAQDVAVSIGGKLPFTIWYDPTTFVPDEIDVPSQNVVVTRQR